MKKNTNVMMKALRRVLLFTALLLSLTLWVNHASAYQEERSHSPSNNKTGHQIEEKAENHGESAGQAEGHDEKDLGQQKAEALAVTEPPAWYGKVVWGIGLLFVLAATFGSAAIVLKGPEPLDPADEHAHH